jgi:hypothetical protein
LSGSVRTVDPIAVLLGLSARGYLSVSPLSTRAARPAVVAPGVVAAGERVITSQRG